VPSQCSCDVYMACGHADTSAPHTCVFLSTGPDLIPIPNTKCLGPTVQLTVATCTLCSTLHAMHGLCTHSNTSKNPACVCVLLTGPDVIPIPGTKRLSAIEDNVGGSAVQLTPEEVRELSAAVPVGAVKGDRCVCGAVGQSVECQPCSLLLCSACDRQ
jgi:hypothetical protein